MKRFDKFYCVLLIIIVVVSWIKTHEIDAESIWAKSEGVNLFVDHKASKVGDILTVIISESAQASNKSSIKQSKDASVNGGPVAVQKGKKNLLDFIPFLGAKGQSKYKGEGNTTRIGQISAKVTVQIVKILPNGNLFIEGGRKTQVNNELEEISISGIIQPKDIKPDNTILSTCIAESSIKYKGKKIYSDKEKPGFIAKAWTELMGFVF